MKFILTKELGRLSKWLRILGFDTAYFNQGNASSLIIQALRDGRIVITRNNRLPKAGGIKIVFVKAQNLKAQLSEVLKVLDISCDQNKMFSRCIICNVELKKTQREEVKNKVPEYVFKTQDEFVSCPNCQRIYWKGTHWGNVEGTLEEVMR